jgi:hypothetical protein
MLPYRLGILLLAIAYVAMPASTRADGSGQGGTGTPGADPAGFQETISPPPGSALSDLAAYLPEDAVYEGAPPTQIPLSGPTHDAGCGFLLQRVWQEGTEYTDADERKAYLIYLDGKFVTRMPLGHEGHLFTHVGTLDRDGDGVIEHVFYTASNHMGFRYYVLERHGETAEVTVISGQYQHGGGREELEEDHGFVFDDPAAC